MKFTSIIFDRIEFQITYIYSAAEAALNLTVRFTKEIFTQELHNRVSHAFENLKLKILRNVSISLLYLAFNICFRFCFTILKDTEKLYTY